MASRAWNFLCICSPIALSGITSCPCIGGILDIRNKGGMEKQNKKVFCPFLFCYRLIDISISYVASGYFRRSSWLEELLCFKTILSSSSNHCLNQALVGYSTNSNSPPNCSYQVASQLQQRTGSSVGNN